MNCKQGDLAIVVKSHAGNEGKIVRCIRLIPFVEHIGTDGSISRDIWEIDIPLRGWLSDFFNYEISDDLLRPIRKQPDDAQDETLTWLDVPNKEIA